jgi:microcystin-dependent protein
MPDPDTPRLGLPRPSGTDPHDVPADLVKLTDKLDVVTATFLSGPASALPPAGVPGRLFFVTDQATILYDTGTTWLQPGYSPGDLKLAASPTPTVGWLVCNGAAIARTTYPALFAAIGVTWGAGDGTSTFNVPDLRGRALMGSGTGPGLSARALGALVGVETVTIGVNEMPWHGHGVSDPGHGHGLSDPGHLHASGNRLDFMGGAGGSWYAVRDIAWGGGIGTDSRGTGQSVAGSGTGVSIGGAGGGAAHNNVPPSAALTMLIKT